MHTNDAQTLIDRIGPELRVTACAPLAGGVSAEVHVVRFERPEGGDERVVVRRHRSIDGKPERRARAAREHALLTVLHAQGLPVPRPRLFVAPDTLVQDFIEGDTALPPDAAAPLALTLAAIHRTPTAALPPLPAREDPLAELFDWLPALRVSHAPPPPVFAGPARLLHGDYWPGNVLWRAGRLAAVLDWEDAALGDPLSDLACARVELACAAGITSTEVFTEVYLAAASIDPARLPWWDLYVSTAALRHMDGWGLDPDTLARRHSTTTAFQARALRTLGLPDTLAEP